MPAPTGIIAGSGALPEQLYRHQRQAGRNCLVIHLVVGQDAASHEINQWCRPVDQRIIYWESVISDLRRLRQKDGIHDIVLAGAMAKPDLRSLKLDQDTAQFLKRVFISHRFSRWCHKLLPWAPSRRQSFIGDDGLLRLIVDKLSTMGFRISCIQDLLPDIIAQKTCYSRRRPNTQEWLDIQRGREVIRSIGKLDIGQATIIHGGIVIGIEGVEGTDGLIRRCRSFVNKRLDIGVLEHSNAKPPSQAILVKMAKPGQDQRFDLPTIGLETVQNCIRSGLGGIAIEAGATLVLESAPMVTVANKHNIFLIGV